jgi:hypothetical protein
MIVLTGQKFTIRENSRALGFDANGQPVGVSINKAVRLELLDNYYLTPKTKLCYNLLEQTSSENITTGIKEIEPILPIGKESEEVFGVSLSDDIAAVYYYDLQGRRIGYALPVGQPVIAHIVLRNGASIVRKIMAK